MIGQRHPYIPKKGSVIGFGNFWIPLNRPSFKFMDNWLVKFFFEDRRGLVSFCAVIIFYTQQISPKKEMRSGSKLFWQRFSYFLNMRNGKGAGKNHLIINFNEYGVISRLFKFQTMDVIDQIDAMLRAR